jgi:hypothetical protein
MTDTEFQTFLNRFVKNFKPLTPIDTGNLRNNSVKLIFTSPTRAAVYVDTKVAPYMPFTDLPWISSRWGGKKNPNEGWFERAVEQALNKTAKSMKGRIKKR